MEFFDMAVLLFTIVADVYMVYDFYSNAFECRERFEGKRKYIILILFVLVIFAVNQLENPYFNLICTLIMCCMLSQLLFEGLIKIRIVYSVIAWSILFFGEFLFVVIMEIPAYSLKISTVLNLSDMAWAVIVVKLISYIIFTIVKQTSGNRKKHMPKKIFLIYICQPVASMVVMIVTFYANMFVVVTDSYRISMTISFALLLVANVLMFYAFNQYAFQMNINMEQRTKLMKQKADEEYYTQIAKMNEEHRRYIHDISNYLKTMSVLAHEGDTDKIISIADEYLGEIQRSKAGIYCRHSVANAIFNEKMAVAETQGIPMKINVDVNSEVLERISDGDMVCILGNLLDNALRAAAGCDRDKAYAKVRIYSKNEGKIFVIEVKNSYNEPIKQTLEGFVTTKPDKKKHGIGLGSVRQTVEKYDGFFECFVEADEFVAIVSVAVK